MFSVQCTDFKCVISYVLHYISLSQVFDNHFQSVLLYTQYVHKSADLSDVSIFLLPDIRIGNDLNKFLF